MRRQLTFKASQDTDQQSRSHCGQDTRPARALVVWLHVQTLEKLLYDGVCVVADAFRVSNPFTTNTIQRQKQFSYQLVGADGLKPGVIASLPFRMLNH